MSHLCGVIPTSAVNRLAKVRRLIVARSASEDAVCCSERFDSTQLSSGARLSASRVGSRHLDELLLATVALWLDHHPPRDLGSDGGAELAAHQVQAGIDS